MVHLLPTYVHSLLHKICSDNIRGSSGLARELAAVFTILARSEGANTEDHLKSLVQQVAREAVRSHPAMGAIFNLSNDLLFRIDGAGEIRDAILSHCTSALGQMDRAKESIAGNAAELIRDQMMIAVVSRSSAVEDALLRAHSHGTRFTVLCSESRPMLEGQALAASLAGAGIKVTLVVDAAMSSLIRRTAMVLVGADGIVNDGVVNKIGTLALSLAARHYNVGCYAIFSTDKIFPRDHRPTVEQLRNPREVLDGSTAGVDVLNYYFDLTPLSFFRGFVTEEGILNEASLHAIAGSRVVHPSL